MTQFDCRFRTRARALAACLLIGTLYGCSDQADDTPPESTVAVKTPAVYGAWGIDRSQGDSSVRPGDNFARYANGRWLDTFEIPADLASYVSFTRLQLEAESDIRAIVEELAGTESPSGSIEQQVGDFYRAWMDESAADTRGARPLAPYLEAIYEAPDRASLAQLMGDAHHTGPAAFGIFPDPSDTTRYTVFLEQSGLGLPDRDYYLKDDGNFPRYRSAYLEYIAKLFELAGIADGTARAQSILELEQRIAAIHWTQEDSRDIQKTYNPMTLDEVISLAPEFDWRDLFSRMEIAAAPSFVVGQPSAIDATTEILASTDLGIVKDWLAFHFISDHAEYLSQDFDQAKWTFFSKTLRGVSEQRERWKRGVNLVNRSLGDAVGQIYVARHFPPDSKLAMDGLVQDLVAALGDLLRQNAWMDEETRAQALLKLSTFEPRIGYTIRWTDYSSLSVGNNLFENALAMAEFDWQDAVRQLAGPVDRERWPYPPQTVNASYSPLLNQITFPAGILQAPFFDPAADPAVNYGAIGGVIGHEIGHGFDDQGRQFDERGHIRNWWSEATDAAFMARAARLGAQFDSYEPLPGANISGALTMGENIGDLGGLEMAYAAYHRYLDRTSGGVAPVIDGLTGDQRFFLAWAQIWQGKYREDELRQRLEVDPHSPPDYRINGPVRNIDAWYDAFDVKPGDALYLAPEERVRIW